MYVNMYSISNTKLLIVYEWCVVLITHFGSKVRFCYYVKSFALYNYNTLKV